MLPKNKRNLVPANQKRQTIADCYNIVVCQEIIRNELQNKPLEVIIDFLDSEGFPPPRHKDKYDIDYREYCTWSQSKNGRQWSRSSLKRVMKKYAGIKYGSSNSYNLFD